MNNMRAIRIEKITLNMGLGATGNIENAKKIIGMISNFKPVVTKTRKRSTFGVPKDKEIGCKVTIRKQTNELLVRLMAAVDNVLKKSNFDSTGNFSFGIPEYISIPQMGYDPKIGILGLDVCVTLERPGYAVKRRKLGKGIGKHHKITREEAIEFVEEKFGIKVIEE